MLVKWLKPLYPASAITALVSREATGSKRVGYAFFTGQPSNGPGAGSIVNVDTLGAPDFVHFENYAGIVSKTLAQKFHLQAFLYAWSTMPMEPGVEQQMPSDGNWGVRVTLVRTLQEGATFKLQVSRAGGGTREVSLTVPIGRCAVVSTGSAGYDSGFVLLAPGGADVEA